MKSIFYLSAISILLLISCTKPGSESADDKHPPGLPTSPETKRQYDNTTSGVYKGVVLGSSGIIILKINNGDNSIKGYLTIDGQKDTLSASQTISSGQPISNLLFKGTFSSMALSANADGTNAQISNLAISGHPNAGAIIVHENSTEQVMLYEGSFSGDINGRINFVRVGTGGSYQQGNYIAKVSTDNYYIQGVTMPEGPTDTATLKYNFYMTDKGGYDRGLTGNINIDLFKVTGTFVSYVHLVGTYRGTVNAVRKY